MFNFNLGDKHVGREQPLRPTCWGGTHGQICDPTSDTGRLCDLIGDGSDGRSSEGRFKQQQEAQKACARPKDAGLRRRVGQHLVCRSSACACREAVRSGLPRQWPQLRLQGMASALRRGPRSESFRFGCRRLEHDPDPKGRVSAKWKPVFPWQTNAERVYAPSLRFGWYVLRSEAGG